MEEREHPNYDNDYDATEETGKEEWHKFNPWIVWIMYFCESVSALYFVWNITIFKLFDLPLITLIDCILIVLFLKIFNRKFRLQ